MKNRLVWLLALPLLTACPDATGSGTDGPPLEERTLGIIKSQYLRSPALAAPATVTAGQPFQATVTTLGYDGCWRSDGEDVTRAATQAVIRPYDKVQGEACTTALVEIRHVVQLRFDNRGTAKIVVQGRAEPLDPQQGPVTVEQTVTVQ